MQANTQHNVSSHVVNVRLGDPLPEGTATIPPPVYDVQLGPYSSSSSARGHFPAGCSNDAFTW